MEKYSEGLICAFLTSYSPKEIMQTASISKTKYYRLKADADFQKVLTERRSELVREAVLKMESYLSEDVEILQDIIKDPKTSAQVKINGINLLMTQLNSWKTMTEVMERLQKLEDAQTEIIDF